LDSSELPTGSKPHGRPLPKPVRLIICFLTAIALAWLLFEPSFTLAQGFVLFLVFFSVGLWITEAVPAFAVGLMIIASLVFALAYDGNLQADRKEVKVYTDTFSSSVIWLLLGGYFLASAITKTGLDSSIIQASVKVFGSSPRRMLVGMMMLTMVVSMFLSNTTTTAMVMAALMPMIHHYGKTSSVSKAMVLGVPVAATIGGMGMMIGCPSNIMTYDAITAAGATVGFVEWMIYGMPVMIGLTLLTAWILMKKLVKDAGEIQQFSPAPTGRREGNRSQRAIVLIVLFATIIAWVTSPLHGLSAAAVSAFPLVILPMAGILGKEDVRAMSWDSLLLIAGSLALGEGLNHSGLLQVYADRVAGLPISQFTIIFGFAYVAMLLSNVMGATATCSILLPAGISIVSQNVVGISMIIGLCACVAILLPVSSPPNAIAFNTGSIQQKDFLIAGKIVALIGPALIVLWVLLLSA